MARGVNKVILVGNLGEDPDVRYMPNGNPVAKISLATSESYKDKNTGQMVEKTEWHCVTGVQTCALPILAPRYFLREISRNCW